MRWRNDRSLVVDVVGGGDFFALHGASVATAAAAAAAMTNPQVASTTWGLGVGSLFSAAVVFDFVFDIPSVIGVLEWRNRAAGARNSSRGQFKSTVKRRLVYKRKGNLLLQLPLSTYTFTYGRSVLWSLVLKRTRVGIKSAALAVVITD